MEAESREWRGRSNIELRSSDFWAVNLHKAYVQNVND